jgi:hypothetical protein
MKNKHLLEKVNAVLKEIEDLDYTQRLAVIYVAKKTLEVNPPNQIIRNKLINFKNFNKVIGQIALHINHIMGGDFMAAKLVGTNVLLESDTKQNGTKWDRLYEVDNASMVYINYARHSKEENDRVLEEIAQIHTDILEGVARRKMEAMKMDNAI